MRRLYWFYCHQKVAAYLCDPSYHLLTPAHVTHRTSSYWLQFNDDQPQLHPFPKNSSNSVWWSVPSSPKVCPGTFAGGLPTFYSSLMTILIIRFYPVSLSSRPCEIRTGKFSGWCLRGKRAGTVVENDPPTWSRIKIRHQINVYRFL